MNTATCPPPSTPTAAADLFNAWQRDLPLVPRPYDAIGASRGSSGAEVRAAIGRGIERGEIARVGAVFGVGAGGAALLCAMQVPAARLDAVAAQVNREAGVNHNYARAHRLNLWFVATAGDPQRLSACVDRIEAATGLAALRLPMRRAYRIDLGFDLFAAAPGAPGAGHAPALCCLPTDAVPPVPAASRGLAAQLEAGLPLVERPYAAIGAPLGLSEDEVIGTLRDWCASGTLRRLGLVMRHHEFGIAANAMTVFDVAPGDVDAAGARLAAQPGVTLCYRREPAPGWPYTLYCMVHGRERDAVMRAIDAATHAANLGGAPREVLFSTRRYKQCGSRYFADALRGAT